MRVRALQFYARSSIATLRRELMAAATMARRSREARAATAPGRRWSCFVPFALLKYGLRQRHPDAPHFRWTPDLKRSYDVVIIGAGGHGLATAYYLADAGTASPTSPCSTAR